jgi:hypothetical protein
MLLAIDNGLKCGLALYGADGRLRWYRSHNFGSPARLRQGAPSILREIGGLSHVALEGGGNLADHWLRAAERQGLATCVIAAEVWRERLLYAREQRSGAQAKQHADTQARKVIGWSGLPRPTALRHDAAEAILVGLWAALELGWLPQLPPELRRM